MSQARNCIKCGCAQERITILEVEIDRCPTCGGLWLDGGEIEQLNQRRQTDSDATDLEKAIARLSEHDAGDCEPNAKTAEQVIGSVQCPACAGKLTAASFAGTMIEQCNACDGIFLDRGELEKAMTLIEVGEATTIMALARSVSTSGSIG